MNRRQFMRRLGAPAAFLGMSSLPLALSALAMAADRISPSPIQTTKTFKVVGIGGAGGNLVEAVQSIAASETSAMPPKFAYVGLGTPVSSRFDSDGICVRGEISAPHLCLDPLGAGSDVNFARAAALRNRNALRVLVTDTDVVCLVAGLGGRTGSGVPPIAAQLAREAGVLPVAVVVMPFHLENRLHPAQVALEQLRRQTGLVVTVSNEEWLQRLGEKAMLDEVFGTVDHQVMEAVQRLTLAVAG